MDTNPTIHNTDVIEWLKKYNGPKFHGVISDPPYGLAFMGKDWDKYTPKQYQEWVTEWGSELIKHLYPGAVCMFFGGTRTYHRLATGLEDAGFEIFDSMVWNYGSGFPKSHNISKAIDKSLPRIGMFDEFAEHYKQQRKLKGFTHNYICEIGKFYDNHNHGGASTNWERGYNVPTLEQWNVLQPLLDLSLEFLPLIERIELERNKIGEKETPNGFVFRNFEENPKTGNKTIDITENNSELAETWNGYGTALKPAFEPIVLCRKPRGKEKYVDCVLNYGSSALNIDGCRVETDDDTRRNARGGENGLTGSQTFKIRQRFTDEQTKHEGRYPANFGLICDCEKEPCECIEKELDSQSENMGMHSAGKQRCAIRKSNKTGIFNLPGDGNRIGDKGGASRFFYTAKSSRKERNLGLDRLPEVETQVTRWSGDGMPLRQNGTERKIPKAQNNHPTVKPIKLTEYLAKLLLPPIDNSSILIPFSGSGSEIIGAMLSGWNVITALEISDEYCNIAENRVQYWKQFETYEQGLKNK